MGDVRNPEDVKRQYGSPENLNSRMYLHQRYSTNKLGFGNWVFQQYQLRENQSILELGCGTARIWRTNADQIPRGVKLILSDLSEGMLEAAEANTKGLVSAEYRIIDAQEIPYDAEAFDVVIANHMLYHVPEIDKALSEVSRVLKPGGTFYATTVGRDNLKEIAALLRGFDDMIDFAQGTVTDAFGLENGGAKLSGHFHSVGMVRYEDSLHITDAEPLVDYVLSLRGIGNVRDIIRGENLARFTRYIDGVFAKKQYFDVTKAAGIFAASNL
ncbi:MAG: class I SAM-dependent methyltransferase [Oscillospiraceae bacterium]|jgi:SAM-dependent methyltransferase|nr:class I SAM-dependent methyltransferase [Oscillospiraceae bacterium]